MQSYLPTFSNSFHNILYSVGVLAGSVVAGLVLKYIIFALLRAYKRKKEPLLTHSIYNHLSGPCSVFFPLLLVSFTLPLISLTPDSWEVIRRFVETTLIGSFAWCLIKFVYVGEDLIKHRFQITKPDNFRERKLFTQLQFVKQVIIILIIFVAAALILMSFATVRKIGTGLLTSAGIASVIIGFAAQRSIGNLLAGFQIAFTQPIRIDDVLVVEGEWGRVEEITFTYVVLHIWDERRLVLPLNYFIEKPFQNWTRTTARILGTVFLYTDYTIPVEAVRQELINIVHPHKLWDKRVCVLQVTDSKEQTLELRALVSAADSGSAFDLRCEVRERLVKFIQTNYPECLPKTRAVVDIESPVKINEGNSKV
ncbi:mechanosensitive ion channel family protein [Adhaeribacter aquaticus]|uniref:mechanosensitive ion channel family protein n=1 Tax=Adhaeribacter aquaticus TaxID=299567 RepID=UPI00040E0F62|nr:mechanosensitive ion channel domain-containing protein [Adhaeribacter aquaticus]